MSATRKIGKFEIGTEAHYDSDTRLHSVYIGERLNNNFLTQHFTAHGHSKEVALARAEFMALLWSAARPGDFKVIDKTIEDILSKDPGLLDE